MNKQDLEVVGMKGFAITNCWKCYGGNINDCTNGHISGWTSCGNCANGNPQDCNIAFTETFEKAVATKLVFKEHVFIEGRLFDSRAGDRRAVLTNFPVKVFLPSGVALTTSTDNEGYFTIKIESAIASRAASSHAIHIQMGDRTFSPSEEDVQSFYALAILPQGG